MQVPQVSSELRIEAVKSQKTFVWRIKDFTICVQVGEHVSQPQISMDAKVFLL